MSTNRRLCLGVELIRGKATPSLGETMPVRTERHTLRRRGPLRRDPPVLSCAITTDRRSRMSISRMSPVGAIESFLAL
jgi:hypothetical protein